MRRVVVGLAIIAVLAGGYLLAGWKAWDDGTRVGTGCVDARPDQAPPVFTAAWNLETGPFVDATPYHFTATNVTIPSTEPGITLAAWWTPPAQPDGPVVILVHGTGSCRRDAVTLLPAGMLARHGFGVLVPDLRDHGDSTIDDGHWAGGVDSWPDVLGAWQWLLAQGIGPERIGLYGGSMGAGAVVHALGHEPRIAAAFLDSPYADMVSAVWFYAEHEGKPGWMAPAALLMGQLATGDPLLGDGPAAVLRQHLAGRPLFIVAGTADETIDVRQSSDLAAAATESGTPVTPWIVDGARHVEAAFVVTDEYERRLAAFFAGALGPP